MNLKNHFTAIHAPQTRRSAEDTQTYRLTVIARSSALNKLVGLFVTGLVPAGIMAGQIRHEENERIHRIKIVAIAACTPPLCAALVRFVHHVGMPPNVRGVKWESVPPAETIVLH